MNPKGIDYVFDAEFRIVGVGLGITAFAEVQRKVYVTLSAVIAEVGEAGQLLLAAPLHGGFVFIEVPLIGEEDVGEIGVQELGVEPLVLMVVTPLEGLQEVERRVGIGGVFVPARRA